MVRSSSRLLGERYPLVRFVLVESSTPHESEDYKGSAISLDTSLPVWGTGSQQKGRSPVTIRCVAGLAHTYELARP